MLPNYLKPPQSTWKSNSVLLCTFSHESKLRGIEAALLRMDSSQASWSLAIAEFDEPMVAAFQKTPKRNSIHSHKLCSTFAMDIVCYTPA